MRCAIIGSRSFHNYALLVETLNNYNDVTQIISGGAKGADALAARYAKENNIELVEFLPDKSLGRGMYHRRNDQIVEHCDRLIAFWDGKSTGTKYTIDKARKSRREVRIITF